MEETTFLGFIFDRKLSFIPHLKYVKKKALKAPSILKVIGNTEWGADRKVMLWLYRSLIRPKLDYGCIVYRSARKSYFQMLDPIHNQELRLCLGAFRTSPVECLYVDAHEPSLGARRAKLSLQYATKIKSLPNHPAHNAVFEVVWCEAKCNTYFWPSYQAVFNWFQHWLFWHFGNTFIFHLTTLVYQTTEDCAGFGGNLYPAHIYLIFRHSNNNTKH